MLARSDTENYTLVAAGSDGSKSERGMNFSVFRKTAKGWRAPSQAIYPISSGRIIDVGDYCTRKSVAPSEPAAAAVRSNLKLK